jgi:hypothetical protein
VVDEVRAGLGPAVAVTHAVDLGGRLPMAGLVGVLARVAPVSPATDGPLDQVEHGVELVDGQPLRQM